MESKTYKNQVALLLNVIPEIAKENCLALHGGTAINLFIRNMPRLSIDIDLTYILFEDRETSITNITETLERIKFNIEKTISGVAVNHQKKNLKLQISSRGSQIKLEVSQINRGVLVKPINSELCDYAQKEFDVFCVIATVHTGQLYGGKICAALDRQHPRDLFDVKYLLTNEGFNDEVKTGFLLCLLSSGRPINELLFPSRIDQKVTMESQFEGMSKEPFTYGEFEETREELIKIIHKNLNDGDKEFLLSFVNTEPDWSIYDFNKFPSVQWKLANLKALKDKNPEKHTKILKTLKEALY
jgi:predicted nucleotidyltransferase component of viral defense system